MWGNPTLVHGEKAIEKILRKQNIDIIIEISKKAF